MSSEQENNDLPSEEVDTGTEATPRKRARKKAVKKVSKVDHSVESDEVTFSSDIKVDKLDEDTTVGAEPSGAPREHEGEPQKKREHQGHQNDRKKGGGKFNKNNKNNKRKRGKTAGKINRVLATSARKILRLSLANYLSGNS